MQSAITRVGQMNLSHEELINQIDNHNASTKSEHTFLELLPSFVAMYKDRLKNNHQTDFNEVKRRAVEKSNQEKQHSVG